MNELKIINEQQIFDKNFKMYGTFQEPLFLAKDVAEWIEYDISNVSKMVKSVDDDEKIITRTNNTSATFLTENGLYEVLMQSRKPIAKQFKAKVKEILKALRTGKAKIITMSEYQKRVANAREESIRVKKAQLFSKLAQKYADTTYGQIFDCYAVKELSGEFLLPLPKLEEKTYTAQEIGKILGVSANTIGRLTNRFNLKTDEYGKWFHDRAKGCDKEVQAFRYFEKAIPAIKSVMENKKA